MSHQRYPSHGDAVKEPHSVSLKVLRLSRPSLVTQYPVQPPSLLPADTATNYRHPPPIPASLAYSPTAASSHSQQNAGNDGDRIPPPPSKNESTNPDPFILSPIVNLPPSFGSAYVGETFSCTLCVNHDTLLAEEVPSPVAGGLHSIIPPKHKTIRDVRIEAEMKTPATATSATSATSTSSSSTPGVTKLTLTPAGPASEPSLSGEKHKGVDLGPGQTLQKMVHFDLKDEGNHVLAVTVSYHESTETGGRTRTFRKLYQFICKPSLIVRTKPTGPLPTTDRRGRKRKARRWVLEAQLENCSEDVMQLERVVMDLEPGLACRDCNWEACFEGQGEGGSLAVRKPVLHPGEVEQVCFVIEEETVGDGDDSSPRVKEHDGRLVFGVLGVGWRGEMGNRGFLSTGKLGTRSIKSAR